MSRKIEIKISYIKDKKIEKKRMQKDNRKQERSLGIKEE